MLRTLTTTAATIALALTATSGCGWFEPEEEDLDFEAYEAQLTDTYNESSRLVTELDEAEARIVQTCLEEQGFDVHPPDEFTSWPAGPRETFMDSPPYETFLPTVEDAERRGFWQWTTLDGATEVEDGAPYAEWEEYEQTAFGVTSVVDLIGEEEEPEFYYLDPEDQYAWYVAYAGEEWAAGAHGDLVGIEPATNENGEAVATYPPPEGCQRGMIDAVYGGLGESADEEYWDISAVRPQQPDGNWSAMTERYTEGTTDLESDYLDCLSDRGLDGWEFLEGQLWVNSYLSEAGEGDYPLSSYEDSATVWPDAPEDTPEADDVEGWLAFERDLAVDFAECGDESGFRGAAEHAWQQAQLRYYLDIEGATFAWQEEMRGYIEKAQEAIGG